MKQVLVDSQCLQLNQKQLPSKEASDVGYSYRETGNYAEGVVTNIRFLRFLRVEVFKNQF